ncbi:ferredoxin Fer [Halopenitus salinus]|uniref:Ferredoxin Fer n=1 Tax=Halopenitus salinus TaxID=1198295 RepID=A0ABD5UQI6_9EURY
MASPYEVLGVDPDADDGEIERAYRRRVLETHPDHGGSAEAFQDVKTAYEAVLAGEGDDESLLESGEGSSGSDGNRSRKASSGSGSQAGGENGNDDGGESEPVGATVEYLDYEVLADRGWSLDDENLFDRAADADLSSADHGRFLAEPDETLLEAAEKRGFAWPYACRGGACANCAVAVIEGELSIPVNHVLPDEMTERGIRLSCVAEIVSDELRVVYNLKHLPKLEELRLPSDPFDRSRASD